MKRIPTVRIKIRAPLRLRLTLAFALSVAVVLAGLGWFLHVRLGAELLRGIDLELRSRAGVITAALTEPGPVPVNAGRDVIDPDEAFAQVLDPAGVVVDASQSVRSRPLLPTVDLRRLSTPAFFTRRVDGVDDPARLLSVPADAGGRHLFVVVGANLGDRNEALGRLQLLLYIGIPAALVLASAAGWVVAGAALRPVEKIRREAAGICRTGQDRRLTVPDTSDELARLAKTLNLLLSQQQAALRRERRFVDEASHELRTPLTILKAELDLATRRPRTHAELATTVATAAEATDRLVRLAEQLLVLARTRAGQVPLQLEAVPLWQFLHDSAAAFEAQAITAGSCIAVDAPHDQVGIDVVRLRQAVHNLVENSLRYGRGTPITIAGRCDGKIVAITVTDHGPGFSESLLEHVFEPFTRGSATGLEMPSHGAGLGLAIVRSVAEAHTGQAHARTVPTGGAEVEIVFPRRHANPDADPSIQ